MSKKSTHAFEAVCEIKTRKYSKPRRIRYSDGGIKHFDHGHVTICSEKQKVVMTIDVNELIDWMGRRAMVSKSGVSKLQGGMITAKTVGNRDVTVIEDRDIPIPPNATLVQEGPAS